MKKYLLYTGKTKSWSFYKVVTYNAIYKYIHMCMAIQKKKKNGGVIENIQFGRHICEF